MGLVYFLANTWGRIARIVAGIVLIIVGLAIGGTIGTIIWIIGIIPILAGLFDFCLLAPLFRLPFSGAAIRRRQTEG